MFISFKSYVRKEEKAKNPEVPHYPTPLVADKGIGNDYWRVHPYDSGIWIGDSGHDSGYTWTTSITSATNTTAYDGNSTSITWEVK